LPSYYLALNEKGSGTITSAITKRNQIMSKKRTAPSPNFKALDENDSYTEGLYHWKASATLPKTLVIKSKFWPEFSKDNTCTSTNVVGDNQKVFDDILRSEFDSWTTFFHLGEMEREVLWLVEMSEVFTQEDETKLDYVKRHMSSSLSEFMEKKRIQSSNQLVREIILPLDPPCKVEFLFKRNSAKKVLCEKIHNLEALVKDGAEQLSAMYANKRWLRFKEGRHKGGTGFEKDDVVYVAEDVNYSGEEPIINCYQGVVSGAKTVDSQVAFYHVYFENLTIDKVHSDSLLSKGEFEKVAVDVGLMMNKKQKA